jgi:hypothetical protein
VPEKRKKKQPINPPDEKTIKGVDFVLVRSIEVHLEILLLPLRLMTSSAATVLQ